jgi:alkanesulfonate monooxygenase SsuD/methylene tetrahydromethanopterin reductase-like flavin-dependent oxidoreductase (luciferase family)
MKVRFGVSVLSGTAFPHRRDLDKFAELIRIIDGSGVELIGTNDTSFIGGDAYVRATLIAQTATNAQVGIHPTNPLTREPQIMAAFMASIDAMTEGRAFLDIGSGDSAVYNIGLVPASRARMADYVTCVRDLLATGATTLPLGTISLDRLPELYGSRRFRSAESLSDQRSQLNFPRATCSKVDLDNKNLRPPQLPARQPDDARRRSVGHRGG